MSLCPISRPLDAFARAIKPPEDLKVSEWARRNFRTSSDYSAVVGEFVPHPYQVEPLDVLSSSDPTEIMAMMCAAQMMKTLIMLIALGYVIDHDPGPVLIVQPTGEDAESFSTERIGPMIADVPAVAAKMSKAAADAKGRSTGNKILQKRFRGGQVSLTGAISDSGLRRRSVRYLMLDEVDAEGYEATKNGDRIARAKMRTVTYWNRKIILCSTPSVEGTSRIARAYLEGDQRRYFVPCPFCKAEQVLEWGGVRWGDVDGVYIAPEHAHYKCCSCGELIPHHHKTEMLRDGRWIAQNEGGGYPSFQISRLYAPDWAWGRVVTELFLPAKDNPEALRQFTNEVLAETWKEKGEAPDHEKLMSRREESYRLGQVPPGVLFLTAGVDVQKAWLEGYVYGWGRRRERWVVDRFRIEESPYNPAAWDQLTERLNSSYRHPSGVDLPLVRFAVDTGHATQEVYAWARQQGGSRVIAVDGRATGASLVGTPTPVDVTIGGRKIRHGCKIWPVNVSMAKSELYGLLAKERPADGEPYPPGWVHFPADLDEEFFKQLTAESLVTRIVKGYRKTEWQKTRERNEALDCANYARAAAAQFGVDRFSEHRWSDLEAQLGLNVRETATAVERAEAQPAPVPMAARPPQPRPQQQRVASSGWMQSFMS
jgi:phage terminase large subunit GpA-like protein